MDGLADQEKMIRNTCGTLITSVVQGGNIHRWPGVLERLLQLLDFKETRQGALSALGKICEDSSLEIDEGLGVVFVEGLVGKLLGFMADEDGKISLITLKYGHNDSNQM